MPCGATAQQAQLRGGGGLYPCPVEGRRWGTELSAPSRAAENSEARPSYPGEFQEARRSLAAWDFQGSCRRGCTGHGGCREVKPRASLGLQLRPLCQALGPPPPPYRGRGCRTQEV